MIARGRLVAALAAVLGILIIASCGSAGSRSTAGHEGVGEPDPPMSRPAKVWGAPHPSGDSIGGKYAWYKTLAASGKVIVGITYSGTEGELLVRLDPATGRPLWQVDLPTYGEGNALSIENGRIVLVAPGGKLTPEGAEGEGPAVAYGFSTTGAKIWERPLGIAISGVMQAAWAAPGLPTEGANLPALLTDMEAIPGETIVYDGAELRGFSDRTGEEWSYTPYPAPEAIFGPDPNGPEDLHLVGGGDQVLIDGHTGKEVKREVGEPTGRPLGLVGPLFGQDAAPSGTSVRVPGVGDLWPVIVNGGEHIVFGTTSNRLVAIDPSSGKKLWDLPLNFDEPEPGAAVNEGSLLITDTEGTLMLK